jgi:hypothetical protein
MSLRFGASLTLADHSQDGSSLSGQTRPLSLVETSECQGSRPLNVLRYKENMLLAQLRYSDPPKALLL